MLLLEEQHPNPYLIPGLSKDYLELLLLDSNPELLLIPGLINLNASDIRSMCSLLFPNVSSISVAPIESSVFTFDYDDTDYSEISFDAKLISD